MSFEISGYLTILFTSITTFVLFIQSWAISQAIKESLKALIKTTQGYLPFIFFAFLVLYLITSN